jgi:D-inositol-3-phosphate glycosyltransferase
MDQIACAQSVADCGKQASEPSELTLARHHQVALLTAGRDRPYALGMASALLAKNVSFDFIGSDLVDGPELHDNPRVRFLNFRNQQVDASTSAKVARVLAYYWRLITYTARAEPRIFHILWNNKFEFFDRILLVAYYKLMAKKIVLTVHNVNIAKRDSRDSFLNRFSLRVQYTLTDRIFVHTEKMCNDLISEFNVPPTKVKVIAFGINNTVPNTDLSAPEARQKLGLSSSDKTLLFFGNIAPYKGVEYLIAAFSEIAKEDRSYRLVIAGRPKGPAKYWNRIRENMARSHLADRVVQRIEYVPDEETEIYFKAADVLILPYRQIFQSGVLFLGYAFGLPVIAADVGALKEEIVENETGFVFRPADSSDLANQIRRYFRSPLFLELENRRAMIKAFANDRYSWAKVAEIVTGVYSELLAKSNQPV